MEGDGRPPLPKPTVLQDSSLGEQQAESGPIPSIVARKHVALTFRNIHSYIQQKLQNLEKVVISMNRGPYITI